MRLRPPEGYVATQEMIDAYAAKRLEEESRIAKDDATRLYVESNYSELANLGKVWVKGDHSRIYFYTDKIAEIIGLLSVTSKSGKIISSSLEGESISNNRRQKIMDSLEGMYFDVKSGNFFSRGTDECKKATQILKTYI
jgi:hypothetical protein